MERYGAFGVLKGALATLVNFTFFLVVFILPADAAEETTYAIGACGKPALGLTTSRAYWASYPDFQQRELSIDYIISNNDGPDAMSISILGSNNTNGVLLSSATPVEIGNVYRGAATPVTLRYSVPGSTSNFKTIAFASADDYCGDAYDYPGPYPGDVNKPAEYWIRPPQTYLDAEGLHIYAATTNQMDNAQMADNDVNGIADAWSTWTSQDKFAAGFSVESSSASTPAEQVIRLTGTTSPAAADWFGLYMTQPSGESDWALGAEARLEWLPGTTQEQKDALADLTVTATISGVPAQMSLGKADIGSGWRRVYINSVKVDPTQGFITQFRCGTTTQNWSATGGGLEIRIRRPQLESNYSYRGNAYTTPPATVFDPGVTVGAGSEVTRELGFAQVGHGHDNGTQGDSPVLLDTSQDWGMFVQWVPKLDAGEIIPNDNEWQIINMDNHWDFPVPAHNEIHLDIDGGNSFPGENRLFAMLWNGQGSTDDTVIDDFNLNDYIHMGDVCRIAYWKTGGRHYVKLNVYRNGVLVVSRLASKQLTVSENAGILKQLTLGIDHREVGYGQTHSANGVFQHASVEVSTIDEAAVDAFMTSGTRSLSPNSLIRWDISSGNDKVFVRTG